ncbi:MAG: hypothetical protein PHT16_01510 [Candidatus Pacebacteria bacterium]|nr:hypothetical protein [Candidatus Paceibacterota bacterium]
MEKHLKDKQYYIDLYDRHTVKRCRDLVRTHSEPIKNPPLIEGKKPTQKMVDAISKMALEWSMMFQTGERYLNKEETIRKWMDADKRKDELYETAQAPENIRCLTCRNLLKPTFKNLWSENGKEDRMFFMYDCPNQCLPRRAFFSDGEEWRPKPNPCPNCKAKLDCKDASTKEKFITEYTCINSECGYVKKSEIERNAIKEEEFDEKFTEDRDRFCLTEEAGKKWQEEKWRLEQLGKFMDEWKEEEKQRAEKLKANPKGFHLEGAGYRCAICGDGTPEGDNWYDEYGIKCLICQKAIDEGEIPASVAKDKDSWYSKYDIESRFGVKGPTFYKWVRKGIIKPRIITRYGKGEHCHIFMVKDNKDILPPKKLTESQMGRETKDGKELNSMHPWYHFTHLVEEVKKYKIMDYIKLVPMEENKK